MTSQEGRETREIVNMGIETKRSDYPSYTKESLNELLDKILKEEEASPAKIFKFVDLRERVFLQKIKAGDKSVARPSSFTKKLENYKRVPPGVISMLNWNELEYNIFNTGSKGYLFKLSGIDLMTAPEDVRKRFEEKFLANGRKLESISLPDEEVSLPPYYVVDARAMLKFAWTDRSDLLLNPIMKRLEKRTTDTI